MDPHWKFPRLRIDPVTIAVLCGLFLSERVPTVFALLLAAAVHEAGHLIAARALKIRVTCLRVGLLGARLETGSGLLSYGAEWKLAAAGPLASFLLAALAALLRGCSAFPEQLCAVSLLLGILNLLPIETFDGGRMAGCALAKRFGATVAAKLLRGCSFAVLFLLWCVSVYLLLRAGSGISWLGFSASLLEGFFHFSTDSPTSGFSELSGEKQRKSEQNRGKPEIL